MLHHREHRSCHPCVRCSEWSPHITLAFARATLPFRSLLRFERSNLMPTLLHSGYASLFASPLRVLVVAP